MKSENRNTREAFLEAALEVFSEKGYFGTSLREIAQVVGVRESALYYHFRSKDELLKTILDAAGREDDLPVGLLEAPIGDLAEFLEEVTGQALEHYADVRQRRIFRLMLSDGIRLDIQGRVRFLDGLREQAESNRTVSRRLMRRLVEEGWLQDRAPQDLVGAFFGPLFLWRLGDVLFPDPSRVPDTQAFVQNHVKTFLFGAAAQGRG